MTHKPKYDMHEVERYDIELCTTGSNLFAAFYSLQVVNRPCDAEYKAYQEHHRTCGECKEFIKQ